MWTKKHTIYACFWEKLERKASWKYNNGFTTTNILTKLQEEFFVLVEFLAGLHSGAPSDSQVIEIKETENDNFIDLTINFPQNMTPQKRKEKDGTKDTDNTMAKDDTKDKDDTMEKDATTEKDDTKDKDDTNVIWEIKKRKFLKKKEIMDALHTLRMTKSQRMNTVTLPRFL